MWKNYVVPFLRSNRKFFITHKEIEPKQIINSPLSKNWTGIDYMFVESFSFVRGVRLYYWRRWRSIFHEGSIKSDVLLGDLQFCECTNKKECILCKYDD